ncbi:hypothetical protein WL81_03325 [Burkholderia ubonensis]|nr:hypothetical protein WL81_03325 [Burkholderia ubonensis]
MQIVFAFLMTGYFAVFPLQTRTTGMSLAYNVGVTIFGGFGPFIIAWLIRATGMKTAPSFYVMFAAVLSLAALAVLRRRFGFR